MMITTHHPTPWGIIRLTEYTLATDMTPLEVAKQSFKILGTRMTSPSVQDTLAMRKQTHGDFTDNATIMQALKLTVRKGVNYEKLDDVHKEALDMICHKMGRILSGDPTEPDHWHDIAGYATLVENILKTGKSHPSL